MKAEVITGDCLETLRGIDAESVHCCVTSPPYWGLRDYGTATWEGGESDCGHQRPARGGMEKGSRLAGTSNRGGYSADGQYKEICAKCGARRIDEQIGLEKNPDEYVACLVEIFREVRRVLVSDGTLWLNLGDSYAANSAQPKSQSGFPGNRSRKKRAICSSTAFRGNGIKAKDLCGIPWRVAFALQADGWYLRQDIIWHKPNPMPESVTDRCTKAHEYIFLLSKSARYLYDHEAIKEESADPEGSADRYKSEFGGKKAAHLLETGQVHTRPIGMREFSGTRNKRSVWTVTTKPFPEAHFAVYPPALIEPCIKAGCPEGGNRSRPVHWIRDQWNRRCWAQAEVLGDRVEPRVCEDGEAQDT